MKIPNKILRKEFKNATKKIDDVAIKATRDAFEGRMWDKVFKNADVMTLEGAEKAGDLINLRKVAGKSIPFEATEKDLDRVIKNTRKQSLHEQTLFHPEGKGNKAKRRTLELNADKKLKEIKPIKINQQDVKDEIKRLREQDELIKREKEKLIPNIEARENGEMYHKFRKDRMNQSINAETSMFSTMSDDEFKELQNKTLKKDKQRELKETLLKKHGDKQENDMQEKIKDKVQGTQNFVYKMAAMGVGGGLVLNLANNKGQQTNNQLYGM